jgi:hypothetical protein
LKASEESQSKSQSDATLRATTASAHRGHGEGSIYRDEANGTWVGAISLGWRPDGKRILASCRSRVSTHPTQGRRRR